jgi:type I restriction enzyme, S subunit
VEKRLGDVVTRLANGFVGLTRNIHHGSGVRYLLARHVKNNRLQFDGRTFISDEFNRKNKKSMLKAGDMFFVQSGHIGHSAVVTEEHEGHNCHAMIVITAVEGAALR